MDFQTYTLAVDPPVAKDVTSCALTVSGEPGSHLFLGGAVGAREVKMLGDNGETVIELGTAGFKDTLGLEEAKVFSAKLTHTDNGGEQAASDVFANFTVKDETPPDAPKGMLEHAGEESVTV